MKNIIQTTLLCALLTTTSSYAQGVKETLANAAKALSTTEVSNLKTVGAGTGFSFGQAVRADLSWPAFAKFTDYTISMDFKNSAIKTEFDRSPPGGLLPGAKPLHTIFFGTRNVAWNVNGKTASLATTTIEPRQLELWATPFGVIKAAMEAGTATKLTTDKKTGQRILSFPFGHTTVRATLLANNLVDQIDYFTDTDMLGDTHNVVSFANYHNFNGVNFPTHIVRAIGGHPTLDIRIDSLSINTDMGIEVPKEITEKLAASQEPVVTVEQLSPGVFFIAGQSHHSTAIEFKDHIVIFDAPQNDARVLAVFAAAKKAIPNKPIRYVVISHNHFDHAGGLRAAVAEGATIITHSSNQVSFNSALTAPHKIRPDHLTKNPKKSQFKTLDDLLVLEDATRRVEIHRLAGHPHNDGMLVAYLPNEKILCEVDAFTLPVLPANAPAPTPAVTAPTPTPPVDINTLNLYDNMQRLQMQVERLAPGHGRLTTINDLLTAVGKSGQK